MYKHSLILSIGYICSSMSSYISPASFSADQTEVGLCQTDLEQMHICKACCG